MDLQSYSSVLCFLDHEETLEHLFLHGHFAADCWKLVTLHCPSSWRLLYCSAGVFGLFETVEFLKESSQLSTKSNWPYVMSFFKKQEGFEPLLKFYKK
jgi:hypothetical protein